MKQYWPMCKHIYYGKEETQWTYDSCLTMDKAIDVIRRWAKDWKYNITSAWVDVVDGDERSKIELDVSTL